MVVATLAWLGYELFSGGLFTDFRSPNPQLCDTSLYKSMLIVFLVFASIFVLYALLVMLVVFIACCVGKPKPTKDDNGKPIAGLQTYVSSVWTNTLNFFGLDELATTDTPTIIVLDGAKAAAPPSDKDESKLLVSSA